ncbi:MAG: CvpA family protein [Flavobacteriales bacterium]|nr:CvpA family protein [Flavobacteriales bacterium]
MKENMDFILIIITSLFVYFGYTKGLIKQISWILSMIVAFIGTKLFHIPVRNFFIERHLISEETSYFISFLILLILIILCVKFLTSAFESLLKNIGLNFTNRFFGAILGFLKGFILISLAIYIAVTFNLIPKPVDNEDFSYSAMVYEFGFILTKSYLH